MERTYIAIDLKSFYASVECRRRGLDPLDTNLVVADESRTDKTICLAVSPSLKSYGIPGRCRLFEVREKVRSVNSSRAQRSPGRRLRGESSSDRELREDPSLALGFIIAMPHMADYIRCSASIYDIYLRFISPDDIHVYSIDEVFIDATDYLQMYRLSAKGFAMKLILAVLDETGITATAGIGPNMYLAKVAMDIMAKHIPADANGVRIAELDEMEYRRKLWSHRPLTDFWRVGRGYARRLEERRIFTMGDIARCSVRNEEMLYRLFGVNAELLIDHAWGWEPCTMEDIKAYRPAASSLGSGQVLQNPYPIDKARLVVKEMADALSLDLASKHLAATSITLSIGYDASSITEGFHGESKTDFYGRTIPKGAHGTAKLISPTSSMKEIVGAALSVFDRIADRNLLVRRLTISAGDTIDEEKARADHQPDLFSEDPAESVDRERKLQDAALEIRRRFGRNAILRGTSFEDGATGRERNEQIGGHKA